MKQRTIIQVFILLGLFLLNSCSRQIKVGFLMDESQTGRWVKDKELFSNQVENLGGVVLVRAAEGDADKQFELAKELFAEDIDILVLVPNDQYEASKIVLEAHKNNIRVISYDRLVKNCLLDFYISFDHVDIGELQAKYITTVCPQGKYALIGGSKFDNNSFLLKLGQLHILQPLVDKGDIEIVYDNFTEAWKPEEGYRLMDECLQKHKDIDAVIAANDRLAGGAIEALKAYDIDKRVYVAGMDADVEACERVFAGTQSMTVYKPLEAIAAKAAEIAMGIARDGKTPSVLLSVNNEVKQVPAVLLPAMEVNRQTINLTFKATGYLQEHNIITEDASTKKKKKK
jgi:D-xylose transport system substrate-binding protein